MTDADYIQIGILIITFIGIGIAFSFSIRQSSLMRIQMKLNLFADYTKRYQEIILNLPIDINDNDFDINKLKEDNTDKYNQTIRYMKVYFDLCSEEYFLNQKGYLDKKVWEEWKSGIEYTLSLRSFIDSWLILSENSSFYTEFAIWVKNDIIVK